MRESYVAFAGKRGDYGGGWWGNSANHDWEKRPLNPYLDPGVCRCPSDNGNEMTDNAFEGHGISYMNALWRVSGVNDYRYRIARVFGAAPPPAGDVRVSKTVSWVMGTGPIETKVILGDWPFNRQSPMAEAYSYWHDQRQRHHNVLFGDGHAAFHLFPFTLENDANVAFDVNADFW